MAIASERIRSEHPCSQASISWLMVLSELRIAIQLDFQRSAVSGLYLWGFYATEKKVMHWCSKKAIQPLPYMYSFS